MYTSRYWVTTCTCNYFGIKYILFLRSVYIIVICNFFAWNGFAGSLARCPLCKTKSRMGVDVAVMDLHVHVHVYDHLSYVVCYKHVFSCIYLYVCQVHVHVHICTPVHVITQGINFSLKSCCLGTWFACLCFASVRTFIMYAIIHVCARSTQSVSSQCMVRVHVGCTENFRIIWHTCTCSSGVECVTLWNVL